MRTATARVYVNDALVFQGEVNPDAPFSVTAYEKDGETADAERGIAWLSEEQQRERADEIEALRRMPREALGLETPGPDRPTEGLQLALLIVAPEIEKSKPLRFRPGDRLRICLDA
jgi:hypothetical protein